MAFPKSSSSASNRVSPSETGRVTRTPTFRSLLQARHSLPRALGLHQQACASGSSAAGGGQRKTAGGAVQEGHAELLLEDANALRQLALAATETLGGAGETAQVVEYGEGGEIVQVLHDCFP